MYCLDTVSRVSKQQALFRGLPLYGGSDRKAALVGGTFLDETIWEQYRRHPQWQAEDLLKLMYQRHCGCGHFAPAEDEARERLQKEWRQVTADASLPLWESIGGGYARLHLTAAKAAEFRKRWYCAFSFLRSPHQRVRTMPPWKRRCRSCTPKP